MRSTLSMSFGTSMKIIFLVVLLLSEVRSQCSNTWTYKLSDMQQTIDNNAGTITELRKIIDDMNKTITELTANLEGKN